MADKADNKTFDQSLGIHTASWKTFGVGVSLEVNDEINALTRDKLRPEKQTRLNALGARKSDQFDRLEQNWAKLIEYLGYTSGKRLRSIAGLRSPIPRTGGKAQEMCGQPCVGADVAGRCGQPCVGAGDEAGPEP
jgi:hypothetical protein